MSVIGILRTSASLAKFSRFKTPPAISGKPSRTQACWPEVTKRPVFSHKGTKREWVVGEVKELHRFLLSTARGT